MSNFNHQQYPQPISATASTSTSSYQTQPTNHTTQPNSSFDARAYKHAAATIAAHNNALQTPITTSSIMTSTPAISHTFDPLTIAKETARPPRSSAHEEQQPIGHGHALPQTLRHMMDQHLQSLFRVVLKFITHLNGQNKNRSQPLEQSTCFILKLTKSYIFVPNDILDTLDSAGFEFTSLGNQEATATPSNLTWWFTNNSSINLIYDHTRFEHNRTLTPAVEIKTPEAPPLTNSAANKTLLGYKARWTQPLIHTNEEKVEQGVERFGASREPYLLHSKRGISWEAGLQWLLQVDGNTVESDFIAYRWHLKEPQRSRTHSIQPIDIWHPSGPIELISKTPLSKCFDKLNATRSRLLVCTENT
ncbi:uncharacterized protein MELLADRAFT_65313 [Melampsora larici-populina 98AG31]|uniref:Uncharacterized protein n=1 Tax=Melampsora larici-populina (strain 98AG31 / pathotype 3-4-7) TaxID=747676 RepID=F4RUV8_MELLP|nr:uncharacterized protein MELLADRAFT_65313 [Melampsora larici-populina 98AG31]EGG03854.1 hypothetical protein MELLADRAFT_65313 [Melampsora larici-populina 98AG31]